MDIAVLKVAISDLNAELVTRNYPHISLTIVGGANLILKGLRDESDAIDTMQNLDENMQEAIKVVDRKHKLRDDWLNDAVKTSIPANIGSATYTTNIQLSHIELLLASMDAIFIMKLKADRRKDHPDMVAIWPHRSFKTAHDALIAYQLAWPDDHASVFMENYIQTIIDEATR